MPSRRRLRRALRAMDEATTYGAWRDAALAHDALSGAEAWRDADDDWVDAQRLRDDLDVLAALVDEGRAEDVALHVHESLTRHHGDLAIPGLHHVAWAGTKRVVERYVEGMAEAIRWLARHPVPGLSPGDRLRRLERAARNHGRTCLMLSGGGTLGWIHLGVVKALFEHRVLPKVISGASMGAMVAAGVCNRTDDELAGLIDDLSQVRTRGLAPVGVRGAVRGRAWLDPAVLLDTIRHNCFDLTFEEGFQRTGRVLNISVSPTRPGQRSRLLNHLTAPHVLIAESALASSAVPGAFPPVTLKARAPDGTREPYLRGERWIDGSLHEDLPKRRMSRLHNVNHFVVSQTNPHVVPFLTDPRRRRAWQAAAGLTGKAVLSQSQQVLSAVATLTAETPLRDLTSAAHRVAAQDYLGDIDLHPRFSPGLLRKAFTNATPEEFRHYVLLGERAAWPHLARIELETTLVRAFDDALAHARAAHREADASRRG